MAVMRSPSLRPEIGNTDHVTAVPSKIDENSAVAVESKATPAPSWASAAWIVIVSVWLCLIAVVVVRVGIEIDPAVAAMLTVPLAVRVWPAGIVHPALNVARPENVIAVGSVLLAVIAPAADS